SLMSSNVRRLVMSVHVNLAVLRGVLSCPPRMRELPSGAGLTLLEVTTRVADGSVSVPVVVADADAQVTALDAGDEVVVVGRVARGSSRAGGTAQSRPEVVAERVVRATRRQAVARAVRAAAAALADVA